MTAAPGGASEEPMMAFPLPPPMRRALDLAEVAAEGEPIPMRQVVAAHADVSDFTDPDDDLAWFGVDTLPDGTDTSVRDLVTAARTRLRGSP